jgi:hypothetical protein
MVLQPATFTKQLVSNGKLAALLKFRISEEIASIKVNNLLKQNPLGILFDCLSQI